MRFVPGEISAYRVDATVRGKGFEAGGFSGIESRFVSDFSLFTKEILPDKSAEMRVSFDNAQLAGSFMDVPFEMGYSPERAYFFYGNTSMDTANGTLPSGNQQFAFFSTPISVQVAPNGTVQKIDGPEGMASLLSAVPRLSFVEYPGETMQPGKQWESNFALPVPGFGAPVQARIVNTFYGYQVMSGRQCGVVQQTYTTEGKMPGADATNTEGGITLALPSFDLNGQGLVYFDITDGRLVHTALNLQLTMGLSQSLGGLSNLLSTLTQDINELSGDGAESQQNLLDLMLTIEGAITLVEPAAPR
jgi:hypothetical protein